MRLSTLTGLMVGIVVGAAMTLAYTSKPQRASGTSRLGAESDESELPDEAARESSPPAPATSMH